MSAPISLPSSMLTKWSLIHVMYASSEIVQLKVLTPISGVRAVVTYLQAVWVGHPHGRHRVHISRVWARREIERRQDHEQEGPITQHIFHYAHRSSAPRLPLLNRARFFGPRARTAWENTPYSLSFRRSVTAPPEKIDST